MAWSGTTPLVRGNTCTHPDSIPTHSCCTHMRHAHTWWVARVDAEGPKQKQEAVDDGCFVCLGGHRRFVSQAGPWFWKSGLALQRVGCELSLSPDGESNRTIHCFSGSAALDSRRRGVDSRGRQRGFVLDLVRRRLTSSRACTNQPVKAPRTMAGDPIPLLSAWKKKNKRVCLPHAVPCMHIDAAGRRKNIKLLAPQRTDCPLNNRGATLQAAVSDDGTGPIRLVAFNTAIQRRLFLTCKFQADREGT